MFRLSFSTLGCPHYTLEQVLDAAVRYGYAGVEFRFLRGTVDLHTLDEFGPALERTAARLRDAGVEVSCVDTSIRFGSPDEDERRRQLELTRTYAEIAAALGAPCIRLFGGTVTNDEAGRETTKRIADGLAHAATIAKEHGVTAVLETHDDFCTGAQVTRLLEANPAPDLGILWDVLHSYRTGEAFEETWNLLGGRIRHVHLKDSRTFSPAAFDLVPTGEGNVPIPELVALLRRVGYSGWVSFEWEKAWMPDIEEPELALPRFVRYVENLLPDPSAGTPA